MHRERKLIGIMICVFLLGSLVVCLYCEECEASESTIWVDDDYYYPEESDGTLGKPYTSIQAAIDAAQNGDSIFVRSGLYSSDLVIDKSVSITAQDKTNTFIASGSTKSYMIDITAELVSLEGFRIWDTTSTVHRKAVIHVSQGADETKIIGNIVNYSKYGYGIHLEEADNSVITDNIINNTYGINIQNSDTNTISGNSIQNSTGSCLIRLISSNHNSIENNTFRSSDYCIYSRDSNNNKVKSNRVDNIMLLGISITDGEDNIIENNTIWDVDSTGVDLDSSNSEVSKNVIYNCNIGIRTTSSDSIIKHNNISKCRVYGLYLKSGRNNEISNNTFLSKSGGYHAKDDTAEGNNKWYNQSLKLGNFWDDFYGPDPNSNYTLDTLDDTDFYYTTGNVYDRYPKGNFDDPPVISNPSPSHLKNGVSLIPHLSVTVEDPNGDQTDVEFYYILNNKSYPIETKSSVESGSTASIPFYSTIQGQNRVYTYLGTGYNYICEWYVNVTDKYTKVSSLEANRSGWIFTTMNVPIDNEKPIANISGPYTGYKTGETVKFNGSGCSDPNGNIIFYRWIFGDGGSVTNVKSPTYIYSNNGTYQVSLVVIDNNGSSATDIYSINIEGYDISDYTLPVANPGGSISVTTGTKITFDGSNSYDNDEGGCCIIQYNWDFDASDGIQVDSTEQKPTHTYSKSGDYIVTLTVIDDEGDSDTGTTDVVVTSPPSSDDSPGFEIILVVAAMFLIIFHRRRFRKR